MTDGHPKSLEATSPSPSPLSADPDGVMPAKVGLWPQGRTSHECVAYTTSPPLALHDDPWGQVLSSLFQLMRIQRPRGAKCFAPVHRTNIGTPGLTRLSGQKEGRNNFSRTFVSSDPHNRTFAFQPHSGRSGGRGSEEPRKKISGRELLEAHSL